MLQENSPTLSYPTLGVMTTTFGFRFTSPFFQRLLRVRLGPTKKNPPKENFFCTAKTDLLQTGWDAFPAAQPTVSKQ